MRKKEQTPRVEQGQKSTSARSHCNSEVGADPNQHGTETHREKSKVADHGSRDSSLVDEESLTSEQVANSATSDRHKSSETSHHGQNNHQSHERRRDICDSDSHHDDRDTRYRNRRSSLEARTPYYEPRQRREVSHQVSSEIAIEAKVVVDDLGHTQTVTMLINHVPAV